MIEPADVRRRARCALGAAYAFLGLVASLACPSVVDAQTNLLSNGSFETPAVASRFATVSSIPGWTIVDGTQIELQTPRLNELCGPCVPTAAADGLQWWESASNAPTALAQTVTSVPGRVYQLRLAVARRLPPTTTGENVIRVSWNGTQVATFVPTSDLRWTYHQIDLVAVSASSTVRLDHTTASASGGLVDDVSLLELPPIVVAPTSMPPAIVGVPLSVTLTAFGGGGGPFTFAVTTGSLPAGLTLQPTGLLAGTPTTAGPYSFAVSGTAPSGGAGSRTYTGAIAAAPSPIVVGPPSLPEAMRGSSYAQTITAGGGAGSPYAFSVSSGVLPGGLTLNGSTGVLSGVPTAVGQTSFTVRVADAASMAATQAYTLTVATGVSIELARALPAVLVVGEPVSLTVNAVGGAGPPFTFAITAGALPGGLTSRPGSLIISGTPTTAGPFSFTVTATDPAGNTGSMTYSGNVVAAVPTVPPVALLLLWCLVVALGVRRLRATGALR